MPLSFRQRLPPYRAFKSALSRTERLTAMAHRRQQRRRSRKSTLGRSRSVYRDSTVVAARTAARGGGRLAMQLAEAAPPAPPRSTRPGLANLRAAPDRSSQTLPDGRESRPGRRDIPDDLHRHRLAGEELGHPCRPRDAVIDDQLTSEEIGPAGRWVLRLLDPPGVGFIRPGNRCPRHGTTTRTWHRHDRGKTRARGFRRGGMLIPPSSAGRAEAVVRVTVRRGVPVTVRSRGRSTVDC